MVQLTKTVYGKILKMDGTLALIESSNPLVGKVCWRLNGKEKVIAETKEQLTLNL